MMRLNRSVQMRGLTPFIDMLFILLFGMLALSDAKRSTSAETVRVKLPTVEPGENGEAADSRIIVIEIDRDSRVYLEGGSESIDGPEALDAALSGIIGDTLPEEFAIEIRGDADARHGVMVALLQHLRRRGFAGVNLLALGVENANWSEER